MYTILPETSRQVFFRVLKVSPEEPALREFFTEGKVGPTVENLNDLRILVQLLRPADEP